MTIKIDRDDFFSMSSEESRQHYMEQYAVDLIDAQLEIAVEALKEADFKKATRYLQVAANMSSNMIPVT